MDLIVALHDSSGLVLPLESAAAGDGVLTPGPAYLALTTYAPSLDAGLVGLRRGFDVGYSGRTLSKPDPKLLWARRPKSVPEPVAVKQLEKVAAVIAETVKAQVKDGKPASKKEAKKAVKELVAEMPGYDWHAHYQRAYTDAMDRAAKQQQAASTAAMLEQVSAYQRAEADDEDAILLMLA
jgi:hypothetical protein